MKKNARRYLSFFLAIICMLQFCACGDPQESSPVDVNAIPNTGIIPPISEDVLEALDPVELEEEPASAQKTIMIYIVGSDLETYGGAASEDITEMMESGVDTDSTTVLIHTGGAYEWTLDISSSHNSTYRLSDDEFELLEETPRQNMADSDTLSAFIEYGITAYPADRYGVILWNHGGGPMGGYGYDEIEDDMLTLADIGEALETAGLGPDNKLEFIGFDACLMSSFETAWLMKDYAKFMIASQENEPSFGWNYEFLETLNDYHTGYNIGQAIVDSYIEAGEWYEDLYDTSFELSLSCLNLQEIDYVAQTLDGLFEEVGNNILEGYFARMSRHRDNTKAFGVQPYSTPYDLVDMTHLTQQLRGDYAKAETLLTALSRFVYYSQGNIEHAAGISLYHPYDNRLDSEEWIENFESFDIAPSYVSYMKNFNEIMSSNSGIFFDLTRSQGTAVQNNNGHEITLTLTDEQQENFAKAQYQIYQKIDNFYLPIYAGYTDSADANGVITAQYNREGLYVVADGKTLSSQPVFFVEANDGTDEAKYFTFALLSGGAKDDIAAQWQIHLSDDPQLGALYPMNSNTELIVAQRPLEDYREFETVEFVGYGITPTYNEDGSEKPIEAWEDTLLDGTTVSTATNFDIELQTIDENGDYYYSFAVTDINGNLYHSPMTSLN